MIKPNSSTVVPGALKPVAFRAADTSSSRLLGTFERRTDALARSVAGGVLTVMRTYPAYGRPGMAGQLFDQAREHARLILEMTRTGCLPDPQELDFAREVGRRRASAAPLAAVLHGYRVGCRLKCDWIANEAGSDPEDLRAAISLTASCYEYGRAVTAAVAVGYVQQREKQGSDISEVLQIPTLSAHTFSSGVLARLSPRERDLLDLIAQGMTNKEIAHHLQISLHTTKEYMSRVLQKTSLPSRAAVAALYAARQCGIG